METSFKSANFEKHGLFVIYRNKFEGDDIGPNMVSTIFNYKAADPVVYIDHSKGIHVITKLSPAQQVHADPLPTQMRWKKGDHNFCKERMGRGYSD